VSSGSAPVEVLANVNKVKETAAELKKKETRLLMDIAKYEADRVKAILSTRMNAFVYRTVQGLDFNMVVAELKEAVKEGGVVVLASGEGTKGGQIVIIGDQISVESFATKVKEVVTGIKGGGSGERWQGKVIEWRKGELEKLVTAPRTRIRCSTPQCNLTAQCNKTHEF
jgi:misacylated tRNA(Ala) deacylase